MTTYGPKWPNANAYIVHARTLLPQLADALEASEARAPQALAFTVRSKPVAWQRTRVVTYPRLRFVNPTALTEWQDQVARAAITALRQSEWRLVGQYTVAATFRLPVPPSWSNKKRLAMIGQPHAQKPDIDNLLKAVLEIMSKPDGKRPRAWLMDDDAQIVDVRVRKVWAAAGDAGVTVEVKMFTEAGK